MQTRSNRTFICSVAFLDIIEYTRKGVTAQIALKEQLNTLLGEALRDVAPSDRIILDTGDGAAISFVGDPEDALFVCLQLRDAVLERTAGLSNELNVRIGVNLGPVRLIKDLNNQANIVGDGINVAQRVMSFAEPNQILVSRSYFEVVSCLSDAYAKLFHYEGSRTDKHVREHEVYAVGDGTGELRRKLEAAHAKAAERQYGTGMTRSVVDRLSSTTMRVRDDLRARPRVSTALAVVTILVLAVAIRGLREKPATQAVAQGPALTQGAQRPAGKAAATKAPKESVSRKEKLASQDTTAGEMSSRRAPEPVPAPAAPPGPTGVLDLAITPWGEIFVDGKVVGVSPPLQELRIGPGRHWIEVRNGNFAPYVQIVEVKSGERLRIRHRFR